MDTPTNTPAEKRAALLAAARQSVAKQQVYFAAKADAEQRAERNQFRTAAAILVTKTV